MKEIRERLTFLDNVGVGYLQLDRASATLSGGEAQRIRLATQIGSQLVGVLYILDEPSIGLHQRDNDRLIGDARAPARPRQHRARGRARRGDDARAPTGSSTWARAPASTAATSSPRAPPRRSQRNKKSVTGAVPVGRARDRGAASAGDDHGDNGWFTVRGRRAAQPEGHRRRVPGRQVRRRHRRLRLRQVDARERDRLQGAREPAAADAREAGRARWRSTGIEVFDKVIDIDQRPIGRTPRSNPATYTDLFTHIRELYSLDARREGARLQARPLLVQRQGRPLRDVQGRRPDQDRDALPARRLRAVRDVQGPALQPRDARGALQGQVDRRRARDVGRGGAEVLRQDPEAPPPPADAARRRARLHDARPAGDDAVGRRGAAREARGRAAARSRPGGRSTSSTSRPRACTSPTSRSCSRCCSGSSTPATRCS